MNERNHEATTLKPSVLEPERYELFENPIYDFEVTRRDFFKILGGGILVLCLTEPTEAEESERRFAAGKENPPEIGAWIHIGENNLVTVYVGKAEMGQNIRTSLAQVVAEELPVRVDSIRMVMGDTDLTPYDRGTFGSRTTPYTAPLIRNAAAAARELLLELAAKELNAYRHMLTVRDGTVGNAQSKESLTFGELTQGKELMKTIGSDVSTKSAAAWTVCGKSHPKVDGESFVTGKHKYTSDIKLPGMLYGKVLRPERINAELTSLDTKEAEGMPGVTVVRDGNFVGVTASSERTAEAALKKIKAEWKSEAQPSESELFDILKKTGASGEGRNSGGEDGSVTDGMAKAALKLDCTYTLAYIAHNAVGAESGGSAVGEWKTYRLDGDATVLRRIRRIATRFWNARR